ncbi:MAG: class I SAM-dependent methyltransferase [Chthoniobacterales bacterium]
MTDSASEAKGLSPYEVEAMRAVEDEHWWYQSLRAHVIQSIPTLPPHFALLDDGCGAGGMLARIHSLFPKARLAGIDLSETALACTRARFTGAELLLASANQLPFPDATFDVVLSLDVLAFRGVDELGALREMHRVLQPGGTLLVNVPAFAFLRGSHDAAVNQTRRYTRPQLDGLLTRAGFASARSTYWNMSLLPAVAAVRWASRSRADEHEVRSDLLRKKSAANGLLHLLTRSELALSRRLALPFGTSLFTVARK